MSPAAAEFASACSAPGSVLAAAVVAVVFVVVGELVGGVVTPVVDGAAALYPLEPQPAATRAASSAEATAATGVTRGRISARPPAACWRSGSCRRSRRGRPTTTPSPAPPATGRRYRPSSGHPA